MNTGPARIRDHPTVQVGVIFPQTEIGADPAGLRAFAQAAEELGYQHLLAYDHVLGADVSARSDWPGPYTAEHQFHEIFVLFGYLAAVAPGLELVTGVLVLPQRQTALAAKQAAEIDVLTGGRFRLGVGLGWNFVEFESLGQEFRNRGRRVEEQIEVLRRLWTEPVVTFEGEYDRIPAAGINPLPVQRPIPVWIGGSAEAAIRRAARLADGFFPQRPLEGGWPATMERFRGWVEEAGRDPASIGIEWRLSVAEGGPDDWRREAEEWRALGATHLSVATMRGGLAGPDAHIERIREAAAALID
jgi:probable F420-dependent oxidoreductase